MQIDITTNDDLFTLETKLTGAGTIEIGKPITVRLSRKLRPDFFGESRVAALLATLSQRYALTVCDWHNEWKENEIEEHFRTSLVGITAALYSNRLTNVPGMEFPNSRDVLLERVAVAGGILEPKTSGARGTSITFCAFDPDWSEPAAFAGTLYRKELFKKTFGKYRAKYLEVGKGITHTSATRKADDRLGDFIFELYQNSYEHGRLGVDNKPVNGMRYVRLRKHIDRKDRFLERAKGFEELTSYLMEVVPEGEEFKFYEVAISDHGLGMIGRFLQTRPDMTRKTESSDERSALLNELLTQPLTSKRDYPGAGYGLQRALRAISSLQGFISLRTDQEWLCGHSAQRDASLVTTGLRKVQWQSEPVSIAGTHFNILLPVRIN